MRETVLDKRVLAADTLILPRLNAEVVCRLVLINHTASYSMSMLQPRARLKTGSYDHNACTRQR